MRIVQVIINGEIVHEEEVMDFTAMMRGRYLHKDFAIDWWRTTGLECGVYVLTSSRRLKFKDFGCIHVESKMNDPDFVLTKEWFDNIIETFVHEQIDYMAS